MLDQATTWRSAPPTFPQVDTPGPARISLAALGERRSARRREQTSADYLAWQADGERLAARIALLDELGPGPSAEPQASSASRGVVSSIPARPAPARGTTTASRAWSSRADPAPSPSPGLSPLSASGRRLPRSSRRRPGDAPAPATGASSASGRTTGSGGVVPRPGPPRAPGGDGASSHPHPIRRPPHSMHTGPGTRP